MIFRDSSEHPKLTSRLKRALMFTLMAVLILATVAAGVSAYLEARDSQDETLLSVAQLVKSNQMRAASDEDVFDDDDFDDSAVRVWEMGRNSRRGLNINKKLKKGFHTIHKGDEFWRIYLTNPNRVGKQFIVAQKVEVSADAAFASAKNTALPLLLLFLVVPLLVTWVVRHSIKPLNTLATKVGNSDSLELDLANKKLMPKELMPFISAIEELLEKNKSYNQRQRRFIANAAHELRTPITALSLQIENVQHAATEAIRNQRQTDLSESVIRLQRLVNQLLDLARAQSGLERDEKIVSLNEQAKTLIAEMYPLAEQKEIVLSVSRNEPVMVADNNNQLQHLIRNALSNAIKFTPESGEVEIAIYTESGQAVLSVSDSGPGVPPDQLEMLHTPFYRPDVQGNELGAGLGLAICHEISAQLGGQLALQNLQPTGFSFTYRQPAIDV